MSRSGRANGSMLGPVMVLAGVAWLVLDAVLSWRYPGSWGGPNIGGGLLMFAAFALVFGGVAVRRRSLHGPLRPTTRGDGSRDGFVLVLGVIAVVLLVVHVLQGTST